MGVKGGTLGGKGRKPDPLELWDLGVKGGEPWHRQATKSDPEGSQSWSGTTSLHDSEAAVLELVVLDGSRFFQSSQGSLGTVRKLTHVRGARAAGGV